MLFHNRVDAGQWLAYLLQPYANRSDVIAVALPRGGVPVAAQIAEALEAPLDVLVVRTLGVSGHPETAMGAIALLFWSMMAWPLGPLFRSLLKRFNNSSLRH